MDERAVVLVTGSSGFIGRALVHRLAQRYEVVGFDRPGPAAALPGADAIDVDLSSDESVHSALKEVRSRHAGRLASVIHLAAYFDLEGEPHPNYERVTVRGTERLLRALQAFDLEQFVFASTMLAHAPTRPGQPINEDSPLDPKLPYRASKIRTEQLIRQQRRDISVVFVRPAGIYDDQGHAAFLAQQIARIHERKPNSRVYPGNLHTGQPFLHLDDLVDALMAVVERRRELPPELALLLAEERTPTFGELQREIGCLVHGEAWKTFEIPPAVARAGATLQDKLLDEDPFIRPWTVDIANDHYEVDISRAKRLLGWQPKHSLPQMLPKIIEALKADPPGWYRVNKLNPAVVADRSPEVRGEREHDMPGMQEHMQQMRRMHFDMLWVHWVTILLGAWLLFSPLAFGAFGPHQFSDAVMRVTAERGLPDPALRLTALGIGDMIAGALVMLFGALSLSPRFSWAQWGNAAVGVWLLFAPLIFWSPSAVVYNNDTLVGALVIAFAILVPMMDESDLPVGWTYSPSTYLQRLPIVALGFVGFIVARQLTAYQLGHVNGVWEPFFAGAGGRNGTEAIVTSDVSKAWPIADAGLGAVSYLFEVLMGAMGDRRRWRTMPWMVMAFGIVVVPLGVVSIYFIIIQPIVIGTWCTLCLIAAVAMVIMIPYTLDELVAMGQFLVQGHRRGESFWRNFFMGGASPGSGQDRHPGFDAPLKQAAASAVRGATMPWTLVVSALLGVSLMFTRLLFGTEPPLAHNDHLVGALIFTVAVMAMAEVGRLLRFINVVFGLWLVAAPWLLEGGSPLAGAAGVAIGLGVLALSLPRGRRSSEHYGRWDRWVL
jgi:nucleoside-diphosphate-sugar epimerase/uncharacterized membrane protein